MKTGKWSDGDQWVKETAGASKVSEEVMTRSRMRFLSCVYAFGFMDDVKFEQELATQKGV